MENFIAYVVSTAITAGLVCLVLLTRKGINLLRVQADGIYDTNRNTKVKELMALVLTNVSVAVDAFLTEKNILDVTDADLEELLDDVIEKIETLTGGGVIGYLMDTFIDNWEEWIREVVMSHVRELTTDYLSID